MRTAPRPSLLPFLACIALALPVVGCGDDASTDGSGGGSGTGGGGGGPTSTTNATGTTSSTTSSTTSTGTTSTTSSTSTGPGPACEDATGDTVTVVLRNDSDERIFLASDPDYGALDDFGWFTIDGHVAGCPCLRPAFCSTGASNESGLSVGYLDPGGELETTWTGVLAAEADASCGHDAGCVLDVVPQDGPLTFRASAWRTATCPLEEGCPCDLAVGEPCYSSAFEPATVEDEIPAETTVSFPIEGTVTIAFGG